MLHGKNISALCPRPDMELEIAGSHPELAPLPGPGEGLHRGQGWGAPSVPRCPLPGRCQATASAPGWCRRGGDPRERESKATPLQPLRPAGLPLLSPKHLLGDAGWVLTADRRRQPSPSSPGDLPGINVPLGL